MSENSLGNFKKNWEPQIAKIEKEAIDSDGVNLIRLQFDRDKHLFEMGLNQSEFTHEVYLELDMLESRLTVALEIARSRFKLEHRGILARIFGGTLDKLSRK